MCKLRGRGKAPAPGTIGAGKIGITKPAGCIGSVSFPAAPEVAPRKAAEDGRPPAVGSFALNGVVDFFDEIKHITHNPGKMPKASFGQKKHTHSTVENPQWIDILRGTP
jgi:hypothetical protein